VEIIFIAIEHLDKYLIFNTSAKYHIYINRTSMRISKFSILQRSIIFIAIEHLDKKAPAERYLYHNICFTPLGFNVTWHYFIYKYFVPLGLFQNKLKFNQHYKNLLNDFIYFYNLNPKTIFLNLN
jgi:hypothetical protein